jgi:hypothetical protein
MHLHLPPVNLSVIVYGIAKLCSFTNPEVMSIYWCFLSSKILLKMPDGLHSTVDLGGLVVSVLATGPKVRGFDPRSMDF